MSGQKAAVLLLGRCLRKSCLGRKAACLGALCVYVCVCGLDRVGCCRVGGPGPILRHGNGICLCSTRVNWEAGGEMAQDPSLALSIQTH